MTGLLYKQCWEWQCASVLLKLQVRRVNCCFSAALLLAFTARTIQPESQCYSALCVYGTHLDTEQLAYLLTVAAGWFSVVSHMHMHHTFTAPLAQT